MDTVWNKEVCMRAGIEMELESRADRRVLRWFGRLERMDKYRMARTVLVAEVSGGLDGWCKGGLGQQKNDGEGCASIRERSERVESFGKYVTE